MNAFELDKVITEIGGRWDVSESVIGDLRSALEHFEYEQVCSAIREVSLESNYKRLPTGKLINACKKMNPNAGRPLSRTSVLQDIFIQNRKTGYFSQIATPGSYDHEQAMQAAEGQRQLAEQTEGGEFIIITGTVAELVQSRTRILKGA